MGNRARLSITGPSMASAAASEDLDVSDTGAQYRYEWSAACIV